MQRTVQLSTQVFKDLVNLNIKEGQIATKETISPVFLRLDSEIAKDKKK